MRKPKQKNVPMLGAVVDALYTSLPVLSIIQFLSIITVLYATISGNLFSWLPWMDFRWFVLIMSALVLVVMLLTYKFVIPSLWTFRGQQMYGYESQLMKEVKALRSEVKELRELWEAAKLESTG